MPSLILKVGNERVKAMKAYFAETGEPTPPPYFWIFVEYVASHTKLTMSEASRYYTISRKHNITKETVVEYIDWINIRETKDKIERKAEDILKAFEEGQFHM